MNSNKVFPFEIIFFVKFLYIFFSKYVTDFKKFENSIEIFEQNICDYFSQL